MNSASRQMLALRKDLLAARASAQRLELARDAAHLRESLIWRNAGRLARVMRWAAVAVAAARLLRAALR